MRHKRDSGYNAGPVEESASPYISFEEKSRIHSTNADSKRFIVKRKWSEI